jgi:hypothetical protein
MGGKNVKITHTFNFHLYSTLNEQERNMCERRKADEDTKGIKGVREKDQKKNHSSLIFKGLFI